MKHKEIPSIKIMPMQYQIRMKAMDAKLRGMYLSLACDVERIMDDIITVCEIREKGLRLKYKKDKIMGLEMGKKVYKCQNSLIKHREDLFEIYSPYLETIEQLVVYRNIMAHGYSEYSQKKDGIITYFNKEKHNIVKYEIDPIEFFKNIKEFGKCLRQLFELLILLNNV